MATKKPSKKTTKPAKREARTFPIRHVTGVVVKREEGWLYFVDAQGNVCRCQREDSPVYVVLREAVKPRTDGRGMYVVTEDGRIGIAGEDEDEGLQRHDEDAIAFSDGYADGSAVVASWRDSRKPAKGDPKPRPGTTRTPGPRTVADFVARGGTVKKAPAGVKGRDVEARRAAKGSAETPAETIARLKAENDAMRKAFREDVAALKPRTVRRRAA